MTIHFLHDVSGGSQSPNSLRAKFAGDIDDERLPAHMESAIARPSQPSENRSQASPPKPVVDASPFSASELLRLTRPTAPHMRAIAARNPACPPFVLEFLSSDEDPEVRKAVADQWTI